jgi:hypothetical protein
MKTLFLRENVYACQTTDGAVFMDLESGEYMGVDLRTIDLIGPLIEGWPTSNIRNQAMIQSVDAQMIQHAIETLTITNTLLTDSPDIGKSASILRVWPVSAIALRGNIVPRPRVNGIHVLVFCWACIRAFFDIKFKSMVSTVRRIKVRKLRNCEIEKKCADLVELVRVFRFLTPLLYTAKDRCLFDSLALVEFLAAYKWFPTWIVGVTTRPFRAHSWVQNEALILNDRLETIELYSPIMVI